VSRLDYVLVDLDVVRAHGLLEQAIADGRETVNADRRSSFTWLTLDELACSGAILALDLELPRRHAAATPRWYAQKCDELSHARWREQITLAESRAELGYWHAVCWRLPWPHGWASRGRIRTVVELQRAT
jgi:hypothetical protein